MSSNLSSIARDFANRSPEERDALGRHLRDRFFECSTARRDDAELRALVDAVTEPPTTRVDGLEVTWHPSARHKALRFVDAAVIDGAIRDRFARPSTAAPHLAAVFADPRELSFRTYENIVPLDRLFEGAPLEVALGDREKRSKRGHVYSFALQVSAATRARLDRLDTLGLYVPPLNHTSRGGERFIFHSAMLAEALTAAMREAMPRSILGGFSHVNPIFRCNRFEPTDDNFHRHHDTPYYDAARNHVSKYTVLLYLTGGTGTPALDVPGQVAIEAIAPYTCVVLDQRFAHEGAPYFDGRKVFLRTELIYEDATVVHDDAIARRFSQACYWTGESIFAPELARHADAYYNQVAAAHWNGIDELAPAKHEPFVHKHYRGVHFVANGYDFWFAKAPGLSLAECAALTLLDYFNCKIGETAFRAQCTTEVVDGAPDGSWIPAFLQAHASTPALGVVDKAALFPDAETPDGICCPFHGYPAFDPTRNVEIVDLYTRAQTFAKAHIGPAPIVIMGQEIAIDPARFVVEHGRIHVTGDQALAPVNFAACWNSGGSPENYLDVEAQLGVLQLRIPPILYRETSGCFHLSFDLFRNSWLVESAQASVPIPKIRIFSDEEMGELEDTGGDAPWFDAVDPTTVADGDDRGRTRRVWWAEDTALVRELFSYRGDVDDEDEDQDDEEDQDDDEDETE